MTSSFWTMPAHIFLLVTFACESSSINHVFCVIPTQLRDVRTTFLIRCCGSRRISAKCYWALTKLSMPDPYA